MSIPTLGSVADTAGDEARDTAPDMSSRPTTVVAVGASAGGLEPIRTLLGGMARGSGMAFVVLQHRTPEHEDLLVDLLARSTPLTVLGARDGATLAADHVYVAPAGYSVTLESERFVVNPVAEAGGTRLPIDVFFRSLAAAYQQRAVCVVLSGSGADGTNGLKSIKEFGGLVIVQDPTTAAFDGMPCNAIATGLADYVLAPARIPAVLGAFSRQPYIALSGDSDEVPDDVDDILNRILTLLQAQTGRDFRAYKKRTLVRRVERRMAIHQIGAMADYLAFLGGQTAEIDQLARDFLISVTYFFRDREAFEVLAREVIRPLVRDHGPDQPIRAWVPACATGEEVYSVAMLLMEECAAQGKTREIKVFGTDLNVGALDVARTGVYPETIAVDVSPERLERFFTPFGGGYKVARPLREAVAFAVQNVIDDPPFSNLDLISCRNVLIYIEPQAQKAVIGMFHFGLAQGGVLFLGTAETTGSQASLFEPISKKWRIYRKVGVGRPHRFPPPTLAGAVARPAAVASSAPLRPGPGEVTRQTLLAEFAPAAALITPQHRILYLFGPTGDFLDLPTGEPPQDLTMMMRGELRLKVRRAVERAAATGERITESGVRHKRKDALILVTVTAIPIRAPKTIAGAAVEQILVTFAEETGTEAAGPMPEPAGETQTLVEQLEYELHVTREDLQSTIQELEASNEALRGANEEVLSINEELQSTNEEIETSKEELQSLNEELSTVNSQLHEKIDELEITTNDLTNLLSSTDIATVFLDHSLRIKRFTPSATTLFAFIPSDIGRPITDIVQHFADRDLVADIDTVFASLAPMEREVAARDDMTFIRRIHPYRTQDNRIEGVVVTFTDITQLKRSSVTLAQRAHQQRLIAELSQKALSGPELPPLIKEAVRLVAGALGVEHVAVFAPSADVTALVLVEGIGWPASREPPPPTPIDQPSHIGYAFRSRQPLLVADFADEQWRHVAPPFPDDGIAGGLAVPFGDGETPLAVLAAYSRQAGRFMREDLEFVQAVANVLGLAMNRANTLKAVRTARDFAESIIDTVREPLLVLDEALAVVMANRAFHLTFSVTPDDTLGRSLYDVADRIFDVPELRDELARIVREGATIETFDISGRPGFSGRRVMRLNARRLNQPGRSVLLAMEDITDQIRARQTLAQAKTLAEQASVSKTRFLAAASHDLRQPVQAAVLLHHLLTVRSSDPASTKLLASLGGTLGTLHEMLDDLLNVSRLDAGAVTVDTHDFAVQTMFDRLNGEFAPLAGAAGLDFRCVGCTAVVRSDPKLLGRILQNLVANAVKYTARGRVLVGCRRAGAGLRIQVWDTGEGIPPEQLTAIFEEFHQIGNPAGDSRRGLGLGLAIVDRLAKLLGHPIEVRSRVGRGSVFEILVPLAPTGATPVETEHEEPVFAAAEQRVLVIDDDPAVLDAVGSFLREQGYVVSVATDRPSAEAQFAAAPPQLIIADYRLQGFETGAEVIGRLNAGGGIAIPGVILTGDTSPDRIREASRSGHILLHKPVSPGELSAAVGRALATQ
ncbi:MAG TPA: chemotaxis protein CheB [Azospirillum sp.]